MEDLSDEELIKKLWHYKFSKNTTMKKISEEIDYNPSHLSKMIGNKKQLSSIARQKIIWFLTKKEKESGEQY